MGGWVRVWSGLASSARGRSTFGPCALALVFHLALAFGVWSRRCRCWFPQPGKWSAHWRPPIPTPMCAYAHCPGDAGAARESHRPLAWFTSMAVFNRSTSLTRPRDSDWTTRATCWRLSDTRSGRSTFTTGCVYCDTLIEPGPVRARLIEIMIDNTVEDMPLILRLPRPELEIHLLNQSIPAMFC